MSLYTLYPVVNADDLKRAIELQYDIHIDDIRELLFENDYLNNSYKLFDLENEYGDVVEVVRIYLKDILPDYSCVLIDVSW